MVGLVLVLPAFFGLLTGYLWPTIRTAWWSFQARQPFGGGGGGQWVGLDNYVRVLAQFGRTWGFAPVFAIMPLLTLAVVVPLLAIAAHRAGRRARWAVRLALAVPMVCFAPVALAGGWQLDRFDLAGAQGSVFAAAFLRLGVVSAAWLSMFGLVCAIGVTVYLAVLRGRGPGPSAYLADLAVGALAVIVTLAVALQSFTYPYVMTQGGPADQTLTPMLDTFRSGFLTLEFGAAAAQAMLVLVVLMVLGLGAACVIILTGLRVEVDPSPHPADGPSRRAGIRATPALLAALGLFAVLAVTAYGLWPWLSRLGGLGPVDGPTAISLLARTWLPPAVSAVVGVGLAAVAGFGIGALRPLGRWSELLLLPFAPWLFVGVGPLVLVWFDFARAIGLLDTFLGQIPPVWLAVPALFLFTVVFRGLALRPAEPTVGAGARYGRMLLWGLPMLVFVGGATWLVQAQSLFWGLVSGNRNPTAPVWVVQQLGADPAARDAVSFGLVLPIPTLVIFAVGLGLLQVFYLDRLVIRVGTSPIDRR
ncbi:MAG: sugar ABC transporter permease [Streptosporangiales bacterium]|nr:sugar ABC transporter permease [Streptosporangiales bacterium]